jgi:prevent-host-death family protein
VAQAKARFSEVVDRALKQGPQAITRNGRPAVVVVSAEEWTRKAGHKGTLAEFFSRALRCGVRASRSNVRKGSPRGPVVSRGWLIDTNIVTHAGVVRQSSHAPTCSMNARLRSVIAIRRCPRNLSVG